MKIWTKLSGAEVLFIEATTESEHDELIAFVRIDEPLVAKIKHDSGYKYCHLEIRKVSDEKTKKEKTGQDQKDREA